MQYTFVVPDNSSRKWTFTKNFIFFIIAFLLFFYLAPLALFSKTDAYSDEEKNKLASYAVKLSAGVAFSIACLVAAIVLLVFGIPSGNTLYITISIPLLIIATALSTFCFIKFFKKLKTIKEKTKLTLQQEMDNLEKEIENLKLQTKQENNNSTNNKEVEEKE